VVNWFCCHTQFYLFSFLLNTLFFANMLHVYLRLSSMIFCILSMLQQQHPVLFFFYSHNFVFRIIEFMLISCEHNKKKESIRKRRGKKEIQNNDVQLMPFFISRHYRCVAISHIHICVHIYIGKSIENVAPKRWKMTICMPSNWFACHFIRTRDLHYSHTDISYATWLDIIGNIVDFQVSLHSFDILEWCQHIENIFMSST